MPLPGFSGQDFNRPSDQAVWVASEQVYDEVELPQDDPSAESKLGQIALQPTEELNNG